MRVADASRRQVCHARRLPIHRVAATLTRGQNDPKTPPKGPWVGHYDENHSEPARLRASNADVSARAAVESDRIWLTGPQNQGVALAAGPAQGRNTVTGTAAGQFQGRMQRDPGSRHADWMPDSNRATVDVHDLGIHAELACRGQRHRRERLVDLH